MLTYNRLDVNNSLLDTFLMKIAIITTRQNYAWTSMQEVLPALERCWQNSADEFRTINVDVEPIRNHVPFLFSCDAFIIIAFNETISRFITAVRKDLHLDIPLVFHLYGHATIAMWPEARFGALELLNKGDVFIGTCPGDLKCMQLTLPDAKTLDIPYPYEEMGIEKQLKRQPPCFVYIGRISDQKNIHTLIEAYSKLPDHSLPLVIYGKEDFLGSPNMGIESSNYLFDLQQLCENLQMRDKIHFKGFKTREEIYQETGPEHIFVSASTHSDENFGMAAMRSLALGGKAVLSSWGGHVHFKSQFPGKVFLSTVTMENDFPVVNAQEFSQRMLEASAAITTEAVVEQRGAYFSPATVTASFKKILAEIKFDPGFLTVTKEARAIHEQQLFFETRGFRQRAFHSYSDPLAQLYLRSYICS